MTKFDVGKLVNRDLLASELLGALGDKVLAVGGDADEVTVHLRADVTEEELAAARAVCEKHNPKKKTEAQVWRARIDSDLAKARKAIGIEPGDVTYENFARLLRSDESGEVTIRILYLLWLRVESGE